MKSPIPALPRLPNLTSLSLNGINSLSLDSTSWVFSPRSCPALKALAVDALTYEEDEDNFDDTDFSKAFATTFEEAGYLELVQRSYRGEGEEGQDENEDVENKENPGRSTTPTLFTIPFPRLLHHLLAFATTSPQHIAFVVDIDHNPTSTTTLPLPSDADLSAFASRFAPSLRSLLLPADIDRSDAPVYAQIRAARDALVAATPGLKVRAMRRGETNEGVLFESAWEELRGRRE